jgi:hypothetical protein
MTTKTVTYVDITPMWSEILPALLNMHKSESELGHTVAVDELTRMAKLADKYVAHLKAEG